MSDEPIELRFVKFCDQDILTDEIEVELAGRLLSVVVTGADSEPTVVLLPYNATNEERSYVAGCVAAHDALPGLKNTVLQRLSADCRSYIYRHYTQWEQASLTILLVEGLMLGYTTRMQYVGQALGWVKAVIGHYYTRKDEVKATNSAETLSAVIWDFAATFDAVDPKVTIRVATDIQS